MKLPWFIENPDPRIYASENWLVLDFETTNLDKGSALNDNNSIVCATWAKAKGPVQLAWGNQFEQEELVEAVKAADFLVMHNAKFDLQWLAKCGVDLRSVLVWDTMIGEYVRLGNRKGRLSLQAVATRYNLARKDAVGSAFVGAGVCPSQIPASILGKYAKQDTAVTRAVFKKQREELKELNLLPVLYTRCLLTPVLADIEFNGMFLDAGRVLEAYYEEANKTAELVRTLQSIAGDINFRSRKQLAELLYDKLKFEIPVDGKGNPLVTGKGQPKTDESTLAQLKATTEHQRVFLEAFKAVNKGNAALSKNLEFFKGVVEEQGGLFHAVFNQTVTATHRLSSSGLPKLFEQFDKLKSVQFHNLPRRFKRLFKARKKGWKVGELDGAQLEFRVAAFLGQDEQAISDIENDVDVHELTKNVMGVSRQDAKAHTFRPLYGGKGKTPKQREYCEAFRAKYKGIATTQEGRVILQLLQTQSVVCDVYSWLISWSSTHA